MRKSHVPVTAALLVVALLVLAGCSSWLESPTKPANDAIEQANGRLERAASYEEDVRSRVASLDELPATAEGAAQGLEVIAVERLVDALAAVD
jgi:outer membrane murein-binding lipoprotein Lpp